MAKLFPKAFKSGNWFLTISLIITAITYFTQSESFYVNSKIKKDMNAIFSDGTGYYVYLPATFIYGDYRFQFLKNIEKKYDASYVQGLNLSGKKTEIADKYYIGTSVLMSPFFLGNCLINKIQTGDIGDGYSKSFQKAIRLSSIFYAILGLVFLFLFLRTYAISTYAIGFLLLAVALGTSLDFYSVCYPSFSHTYSFAAISCFLWLARFFVLFRKKKYLYWLCIIAGLVIIIRPTNGLVLLIFPFLFNDYQDFKTTLKVYFRSHKLTLAIATVLFLGVVSLQLINVYLQTNSFNPYTYGDESFKFWNEPKIIDVLLSYRKGLFTYAPVLFLIIPGLIILYKKNRYLFWGWLIVFSLNLYLISSWWCWWYGGGLGMRPFVDLLALLIIPIAFLLQYSFPIIRIITAGAILFGVYVYQVYQYQFNHEILHYENMTEKTFWRVFLSTSSRNTWIVFYQNEDLPKSKLIEKKSYYYDVKQKKWSNNMGSNNFDFGIKNKDLEIYKVIHFDKSSKLKPAFQISADIWIKQSESNPSFFFMYFKDGEMAWRKDFYVGSRITELSKTTAIHITANPPITQADFDSVYIFFERSLRPVAIRNLRFDYLLYENHK